MATRAIRISEWSTVPDDRLERLTALYQPRKQIHATIEYADVAATSAEALKRLRCSTRFAPWIHSPM